MYECTQCTRPCTHCPRMGQNSSKLGQFLSSSVLNLELYCVYCQALTKRLQVWHSKCTTNIITT